MNRTQLLSLGSALGLTLKKSSPVDVKGSSPTTTSTTSSDKKNCTKQQEFEDEIGPLTASPPASPPKRMSSSSASFFPNSNSTAATAANSRHSRHNSTPNSSAKLPLKDLNRIGSFAAHNLPKLRESKWFSEPEARIFCVVAEIGFIVEIRKAVDKEQQQKAAAENNKDAKEYKSLFGVVTKKECINQSAEGVCLWPLKFVFVIISCGNSLLFAAVRSS